MHINDSIHANFLAAAIQKRKQAAGVVSMPMRYHHAFNRAKRRSETRQIAGEGFGVRTGVEECKSGLGRVCCLICFLVTLCQLVLWDSGFRQVHTIRAEKP
jgi:hypothetical protein